MEKEIITVSELKRKMEACKELEIDYRLQGTIQKIEVMWDDTINFVKDNIHDALEYNNLKVSDIKCTSKTIAGNKMDCIKIGKDCYIFESLYMYF